MATNCTATPDALACTLDGVGEGLGNMFTEMGDPLGNFLIIIGIAGGVVALFLAVAGRVKGGL